MTTAPSTADELMTQFQRIERAWQAAEEKLAATRVPIDVRVKVMGDHLTVGMNIVGELQRHLAYCKIKGSRRVCVIEETQYYNTDPTDWEEVVKPITECPVDVRLEMFDSFTKMYY
jgi:hypothetical protein